MFIQKLFVQTAQQVAKEAAVQPRPAVAARRQSAYAPVRNTSRRPAGHAAPSSTSASSRIKPLYDDKNWIPMMLNMLREKRIRITDPAVLQHLIYKPFFPEIYEHLSPEERSEVDRYNWKTPLD
ncbi:MAG: hypothetical protein D6730_15460 [Bacteroidetes bacterium]|nr:MAG: hypothetical protein D6730_15460 [Bacteroidota bacterium]